MSHIVKKFMLVVLVTAVLAATPTVAFAGGPNGKGKAKGHDQPAVTEVANKPAKENGKPNNGNVDKGPKAGPAGGGMPTPTPTPMPTLAPTKSGNSGAIVIKDQWENNYSYYYGCSHYAGSSKGILHEVITKGSIVSYGIRASGWNQGTDCSGYVFYRYDWQWKLKVLLDKTTGQRRLEMDWYESEGTYYGKPSLFRSLLIIVNDEVKQEQLWVLVDGKRVKVR